MKAAAADKGTARQSTVSVSRPTPLLAAFVGRAMLETPEQMGKSSQCGEAHHNTYQGTAERRT